MGGELFIVFCEPAEFVASVVGIARRATSVPQVFNVDEEGRTTNESERGGILITLPFLNCFEIYSGMSKANL